MGAAKIVSFSVVLGGWSRCVHLQIYTRQVVVIPANVAGFVFATGLGHAA